MGLVGLSTVNTKALKPFSLAFRMSRSVNERGLKMYSCSHLIAFGAALATSSIEVEDRLLIV